MTKPEPAPVIEAVIFDLDGVIVSTDEYHYLGWQRLADELGIPFNRHINERLRGVSRMESLDIILEQAAQPYTAAEKLEFAERKNTYYREFLQQVSPKDILPGVLELLAELKTRKIKIAIGSSSRNTPLILAQIGLSDTFDAVADGNDITRSKPDPEVFLLAAERLGVPPSACLVVEDADAGVESALAAGMSVLGVGSASNHPRATSAAQSLQSLIPNIFYRLR
jgi:beta-phosphoglucomutase